MQEVRNWLSALYNHPHRNQIIANILNINYLDVKSVKQANNLDNKPVLSVKYTTIKGNALGGMYEPEIVEKVAYIGEYFINTKRPLDYRENEYPFSDSTPPSVAASSASELVMVLEKLNQGNTKRGKTYTECLDRESRKVIARQYSEDVQLARRNAESKKYTNAKLIEQISTDNPIRKDKKYAGLLDSAPNM